MIFLIRFSLSVYILSFILFPLLSITQSRSAFWPWPEAEFLDEIQTKVWRVFLLASQSHLYSYSFALRFLFLQTPATSNSFYSALLYTVKETGGKPHRKPLPYGLRNPHRNLNMPETSKKLYVHEFGIRNYTHWLCDLSVCQVEYRESSKGKIARQLEIAGQSATDEELEQMLEVRAKDGQSVYETGGQAVRTTWSRWYSEKRMVKQYMGLEIAPEQRTPPPLHPQA